MDYSKKAENFIELFGGKKYALIAINEIILAIGDIEEVFPADQITFWMKVENEIINNKNSKQ